MPERYLAVDDLRTPVPLDTGAEHVLVIGEHLTSTLGLDQLTGLVRKRQVGFFILWLGTIFGMDIPATA